MKRKAVREIYATICEWSAAKTRPYERGLIGFDEYMMCQAETMNAARERSEAATFIMFRQ